MIIDTLSLLHFRNYDRADISLSPNTNVIYGENAQGKTNLLEAVVYLSTGHSPRTRFDKEMISFGEDDAMLRASVLARDRDFKIEASLFRQRQKKISINGVKLKRAVELSGVLNTVFFCPEDLFLIRDGAAARRRFMDISLCQLRPRYAKALSQYAKLYESKTRILRDSEEHPDYLKALPEFNMQMALIGAILIHYRGEYCKKLNTYAAAAHEDCSGGKEKLELFYRTVKTVDDPFADENTIAQRLMEHMESHEKAELAARLCLSGPHKDDIEVMIGGKSAKAFSSQGQTRTAALSMKLAEREIHKNVIGEYPVLLLDDVLSELDPKRQEFVLNRICGGQVFITCCEDDRLAGLKDGNIFHIKDGNIFW